jgi:hypothetical protein
VTTQQDPTASTDPQTDPSTGDEPTVFDAAYVKALRAEAAKYRTEAKANAEAAQKLAEFEDAQKTEAQKLADAKTAAEQDAAAARADALRWKTAAKFGITDAQAELFLTGADEATLTRQAEALAALKPTSDTTTAPAPRADLSQGARNGASTAGGPAAEFANFIGGQLKR